MNVTYVNLANDLEGVNFSSIRQGTLDEREHWKEMQEGLIEQLLAPIFEAWLRRALLKGRIVVNGKPLRAERLEKYRAVVWQPRRWDWIDPNADVKAAVTSKNNLLASPSQIIRDRGQPRRAKVKAPMRGLRRVPANRQRTERHRCSMLGTADEHKGRLWRMIIDRRESWQPRCWGIA